MHGLKLAVLFLVGCLPGRLGVEAETRRLRRIRARASIKALALFEDIIGDLQEGAICIDLGANVGIFTERMAVRGLSVHAFEPDPWAFGKLTERVGHLPNVTLHNVAVGTQDGTVTIRRAPDFDANPEEWSVQTSVVEMTPDLEVGQTMEVDQVDFLAFLHSLGRQADVVKMDIEGAEAPLLEKLFSSPELDLIGALFVETHEVNMPALRPRIARLRGRARGIARPIVNLDWP